MSPLRSKHLAMAAIVCAAATRLLGEGLMWGASLAGSSAYPATQLARRWSVPVAMAVATIGVVAGRRHPLATGMTAAWWLWLIYGWQTGGAPPTGWWWQDSADLLLLALAVWLAGPGRVGQRVAAASVGLTCLGAGLAAWWAESTVLAMAGSAMPLCIVGLAAATRGAGVGGR